MSLGCETHPVAVDRERHSADHRPDVGIATLEQIIIDSERGTYRYRLADDASLEPATALHAEGRRPRRTRSHHAHFDKAYLITMDNLRLSQVDMQKKWDLYKFLKENYTAPIWWSASRRGVEKMLDQGVTYCRTMVDADSTVNCCQFKRRYESEGAVSQVGFTSNRRAATTGRSGPGIVSLL